MQSRLHLLLVNVALQIGRPGNERADTGLTISVRAAADWWLVLGGLAARLLTALVSAPVGVSGAVLLLPVQLSVLGKHHREKRACRWSESSLRGALGFMGARIQRSLP
ncbi:hypothetical protein ACODT5_22290 [Streptomyces sp. 5.8]|uniref:hypothetical protein n=1 Tax=Streptomyces sp. 5.8 TaxID=3406571 RepID=UPI003BB52D38